MSAGAKLSGVVGKGKLQAVIDRLVEDAQRLDQTERRAHERHPYFRPVIVTIDEPKRKCFSAFSRELSRGGIGLLHNMPLNLGSVVISITHDTNCTVNLPTEILWCRPCGEGWYLSGGRFVDTAND